MTTPVELANKLNVSTQREWLEWVPESLNKDGKDLDLAMAVQVALTNPDVFDTWHLFNAVVIAFNGRRVNFEWLDKPSLKELAWGVSQLQKLAPSHAFSEEVRRYIGCIMMEEGLVYFPWCDLDLGKEEWCKGLCDVGDLGTKVKAMWDGVKDVDKIEDVDATKPLHVQLDLLVRCVEYIKEKNS